MRSPRSSSFRRFSAALPLLLLLSAQRVGGAWEEQLLFPGALPGADHGRTVLGIGDIDGDTWPDYIVGAPLENYGGYVECGVVYAMSGATNVVLWRYFGRSNFEHRGAALALAGNWDADTAPDIAVGVPLYDLGVPMPDAGILKVISGATGLDLFTYGGANAGDRFGTAIAGGFDYENDGVPDLLVGAPGFNGVGADAGRCYLIDASGLKATYDGPGANALFGSSAACIGDLNGDLYQDFLIGAPGASPGGRFQAGQATALSGASGLTLKNLVGAAPMWNLGHAVAGGRDLDGDLVPDYAISAPGATPGGRTAAGIVSTFSGAGGTLLRRFQGEAAQDRLGSSLNLCQDLNHDGHAELLIGGLRAGQEGLLQIRDGATGLIQQRIFGSAAGDQLGCAADAVGDVDGDGEIELVLGVAGADPSGMLDAGQALLLGFHPCMTASADTLSVSAGGSISFLLDFPITEAGRSYSMLASRTGTGPSASSGLAIPLTVDPIYMRFWSGSAPPWMLGAYGVLNAAGDGAATLALPPGAAGALVGSTVWFAAVSLSAPNVPALATIAAPVDFMP